MCVYTKSLLKKKEEKTNREELYEDFGEECYFEGHFEPEGGKTHWFT